MAMPVKHLSAVIMLTLAAFGASNAQAQTLAQRDPSIQRIQVVQFGMPADSKFIVCVEGQCPERTIKHLHTPKTAVPVARTPVSLPADIAPKAVSPAKVELPKPIEKIELPKPKKKAVRKVAKKKPHKAVKKKPAVEYECKPLPSDK